ncbi:MULTISPECIES: ABC transporter substrate-binding protein [Leptospira]|uniref:ABC transporter substrate-binding protein n=1 Tax=Leptospira TaxID=171 RepID=UPI0002786154|nr:MULTISPECIES: ABC transporter substrate-binding protein [Leptospira]EJO69500.1 toluene tolerance protein Ttg2D [Leptospira kirschneri serovar Grippotyphosa str. RM52]EKQ82767.1 toluene tolerance protein Ttg2D [Leptospira kirschneri serovar Grippotyphosa str. Moskva]EKR07410.1 toluene tolerance protein Ttg2D [Leptospira kirschneri serovar Valbuzzi str. 200702274]EMJ85513.1 toluene tolerance protein Ttg2D [Leptospira kirschneri str. JB]EMN03307.1 toluene tolerance protein Ttg2D [Leptospira ki
MNSSRHKLQSIKAPIVKKIILILFVLSLLISSLIAQTSTENSTSTETGNVPATTETAPSDEEQIVSTVKKLIGFIRYKKNDKAIALIHVKQFSNQLLKSSGKISDSDRKEFEEAISEFIIHRSFPIAHKYFDKIDINYEKPVLKGDNATLASSIIWNGSERITFSWILTKIEGNWYVTDFLNEGKYASETNRVKSIDPSIKKNGIKQTIALIKKEAKN